MTTGEQRATPSNLNLPNAITIARIALTPVFVWLFFADDGQMGPLRWWAAVLFVVAIGSDGIDGAIARRRGLVTELGKLLDPIADKVLTGAALVILSVAGELPWWVTILVLVREVGITVHRMVVLSDHVVAAAWMGKLKTVMQGVAISLALVPLPELVGEWFLGVNVVTMTIAVVLTVASGIDYVVTALRSRTQR
ncbi:CDP-diacylglycerol--glycerol-3-phosphate 3-phosphatidyltransferase [Mycetocola reblochoni]|uniref:CDP-diacylglycerol--glycerol-3-phosphate 3-phosphatidyltransferase n=2 Tax=Mycetocola reblochoni TaxID=331618 RepID=A0A1R4IFZ6_9MICO|nr:CDP-diacylglycerol--glycerol-3-phosphate 3-phosphatidyltransferase [Mycetocola reblochoni]RLP68114.1 CDP-diacylglycerol--glycerol-3-phosphate 3-phosphatidyltransferase [Mycetocola reblochoni]SJN18263.1 CDP-diacylglycerol--glycerol-3-phosphate 3-phosphatidyltransferase [Mycetocola reblochoni REB411]